MVVLSASLFIATIVGTIVFSLLNPLTHVTLVSGIFAAFIVVGTCSAVAALVSAVKVIHATCCCPKIAKVKLPIVGVAMLNNEDNGNVIPFDGRGGRIVRRPAGTLTGSQFEKLGLGGESFKQ